MSVFAGARGSGGGSARCVGGAVHRGPAAQVGVNGGHGPSCSAALPGGRVHHPVHPVHPVRTQRVVGSTAVTPITHCGGLVEHKEGKKKKKEEKESSSAGT